MTPFHQYDFVSPDPLYAVVREELRSYFDTGAADDLLFPTWTQDCLRKLGRGTKPLLPVVLSLSDYKALLPEDFSAAREVWLVVDGGAELPAPTSVFTVEKRKSCLVQSTGCSKEISILHKENHTLVARFTKEYLLRPGSVTTRSFCSRDCRNFSSTSTDSFDIQGRWIATNFREGTLYILYYSQGEDDCGNLQIPDNPFIEQYLKEYLLYKTWKMLADNAQDEGSMNRLDRKAAEAGQRAAEAYIRADIEMKKETTHQKAERLKRQNNRLNRFNIR